MRRRDQAGVADGIASGIEDIPVIQGRRKIRMIEKIEELGSELDVERVRDSLDVVILQQRRIEIDQSRTDQRVAPQVAAKGNRVRH